MSNLGGVGPDTNASEQWLYYEGIGTLYGGQVDPLHFSMATILIYLLGRPEGRGEQVLYLLRLYSLTMTIPYQVELKVVVNNSSTYHGYTYSP